MLTQKLAAKVAAIAHDCAPQEARAAAKLSVIDAIGVMVAARQERPVEIVRRVADLGAGQALEIAGMQQCSPQAAALINGVAAHTLDYDDVALRGHPGAVMVPALLALAGHIDASGAQLLDAYIAGYEAWSALVFRDEDIHHLKGWHPTGVFGAVGAAGACAALLKLDAGATAHALGLGASMSAGVMANFGSMTKPFHAGRAAQAGVLAALLAQQGFTAGVDALEHDQGFLMAVSPQGRVNRDFTERDCASLAMLHTPVSIKKFPTCYYTHRAIDAILTLKEKLRGRAADICVIEVRISKEHATVLKNHAPMNALEAKFSIEFAMACAAVHGRVSLTELTDDVVQAELVQQLMRKVVVVHAHCYSKTWKGAAEADSVVVRFNDGSELASAPQVHAVGDAANPLQRRQLEEKFISCVDVGKLPLDASKLLERLWNLHEQNVRGLWE